MITIKVSDLVNIHKDLGFTNQTRLSEALGMHRSALGKLIRRETPPRIELETIEKLCRFFNVSPNELFEITNDDGSVWKPDPNHVFPVVDPEIIRRQEEAKHQQEYEEWLKSQPPIK